jgi:hypothetical protein
MKKAENNQRSGDAASRPCETPVSIVERMVLESVERAMQVVLEVMERPTRRAHVRLTAALMIIELANKTKQGAPGGDAAESGNSGVHLLDSFRSTAKGRRRPD